MLTTSENPAQVGDRKSFVFGQMMDVIPHHTRLLHLYPSFQCYYTKRSSRLTQTTKKVNIILVDILYYVPLLVSIHYILCEDKKKYRKPQNIVIFTFFKVSSIVIVKAASRYRPRFYCLPLLLLPNGRNICMNTCICFNNIIDKRISYAGSLDFHLVYPAQPTNFPLFFPLFFPLRS